jgi:phosphopentomutase
MRIVLIVMDGVGAGELPDAALYGDGGSNTLGNLARWAGRLELPNLVRLGLARVTSMPGVEAVPDTELRGSYGRLGERSPGKDSVTGHWELAGLILDQPFRTYPNGFPEEILTPFRAAIGRDVLGNVAASGTEIIQRLGDEHMRTGSPIVYTSADSVFQIAMHEDVIPLAEQYTICETARRLLTGAHLVGRVIARPFVGTSGAYRRDVDARRDYSVEPFRPTVLDILVRHGIDVWAVGKIDDLFAHRGLTRSFHCESNAAAIENARTALPSLAHGLMFVNLVDFDTLWGHRNDAAGFARALADFDAALPLLTEQLADGDVLIITGDHGNDPTDVSTDHTREYVPLLVYAPRGRAVPLGDRASFADVGATIAEAFGVAGTGAGVSFLREVRG